MQGRGLSVKPNMCPGIACLFGFPIDQDLRPEHAFRWSIFVITARVLDALATIIRPSSLSTITVASTKMRFFPARNTSARQNRFGPEAGRKNEALVFNSNHISALWHC